MSELEATQPLLRWCVVTPLLLFFGLPVVYVAWALHATMTTYDYRILDMDWNANGWITPGEIFDSIGIGTTGSSTVCREYFLLKDGYPIRKQCPNDRDRTHR